MFSKSNQSVKQPKKKKSENIDGSESREKKEQQDDLTSDSSSASESSSEDEIEKLARLEKSNTIVIEMDHKLDERLTFSKDVYNYTICANMTKCCSPLQQGFALK